MILSALACPALACGGVSGSMPIPPAATGLAPAFASTSPSENHDLGVRSCLYDPAAPEPAPAFSVPAGTPTPYPTSTPPSQSAAEPQDVVRQTAVFTGFWNAVNEHYVDPGFNGKDWGAIGDRYQTMIEGGLSDEAFYALLQEMINELGDQHSYFQSPATVGEEEAALAGQLDFVGIGALLQDTTEGAAQVLLVFPTGPAAEAGLLSHDTILAVDGGPVRYENGASRTRGPEGTTVGLTVRSPGQGSREITLTRRRLTGGLPVDACMVPGTRLGYVMLPTFLDETIDDQMREALQSMTSEGPLDGLVLDMRMNGGGLGSVAQASLAVFLGGPQGAYVTREAREELVVEAEDVGGSQGVPLVVLVGPDTVSYGEIVRGILQLAGRATVVGQATLGNVEQLRRYDFEDGSRAWIASATFEPLGLPAGTWEDTGIVPEVLVPGRWDEFGEATDPGLAAAVEILRTR
jgi:C-terminal peptidase prc